MLGQLPDASRYYDEGQLSVAVLEVEDWRWWDSFKSEAMGPGGRAPAAEALTAHLNKIRVNLDY